MPARGRTILALVLLAAAALVPAAPALGHAGLVSASPPGGALLAAAPGQVRLALAAPVSGTFLRLEVTGPRGRVVSGPAGRDPADPQAVVARLRPAGPGTYRVAWRAFSGDGHVTGGTLAFAVRRTEPVPPPPGDPVRGGTSALGVVARLLLLSGALGLIGLAAVRAGVVGAAWREGGVWPPGPADRAGLQARSAGPLQAAARGWWRAWWALVAAAGLGVLLLPVAQLRALRAGPGDLTALLADTRWGRAIVVVALAVALAALAGALLARRDRAAPGPGWAAALAGPPALAALALAWSGHASTGSDVTLNVGVDAVHAWATGLWLGGLVVLLVLVAPALRPLDEGDRVRLGAGVVVRFSALAVAAVVALVVTGTYRALAELSSLDDLWDTGYGRALAVKLLLFAVMLAGGAYNRFVVHPRLERTALGLDAADRGAARALGASVRAELVLALGVMVCVALLTALPPPG
ncbi:MAG: CopD family protein [Thermoleophilia bacterium]|jgi:copper transport protein|nr:CopD family protein [Thermoleophilia bacterium]